MNFHYRATLLKPWMGVCAINIGLVISGALAGIRHAFESLRLLRAIDGTGFEKQPAFPSVATVHHD